MGNIEHPTSNAERRKCAEIECPAFTAHLFGDGSFRLLPPAGWLEELCELQAAGKISATGAKEALETWKRDATREFVGKLPELRRRFAETPLRFNHRETRGEM